MDRKTLWIAGGAIMISITGGNAIAATSGDADDRPLTGAALASAKESALDHTAGTVTDTEVGDEGAAYSVEIRRDDGTEVEISLDKNLTVIGEESDDGEKADRDDSEIDDRDDDGTVDRDDDGTDDRDD